MFESRLELARLLLADFDPDVVAIVGQPFQMVAAVKGRVRRHVPDYFLLRKDGTALIVNVKPADQAVPKVAEALEWPRRLLVEHGWDYEVWTGADAQRLANVRFLAGYRRPDIAPLDETVLSGVTDGDSIVGVELRVADRRPAGVVRRVLLRALWEQRLVCDLDNAPLDGRTVLRRAS